MKIENISEGTTAIFRMILDTRSFTHIGHLTEDALPAASDSNKAILQEILEARTLDGIYIIAHEALGQFDKAAEIREFQKKSIARKAAFIHELN